MIELRLIFAIGLPGLLQSIECRSEKLLEPFPLCDDSIRCLVDQEGQNLKNANDPKHLVVFGQRPAVDKFSIVSGSEMRRERFANAFPDL